MTPPTNDSIEVSEVLKRFEKAIECLLCKDMNSLRRDLNEAHITSKLSRYLAPLFPEWDVNDVYNRNGSQPKRIRLPKKDDPTKIRNSNAIPDIIVHKQMEQDYNLLLIEAKKSTNTEPDGEKNDLQKIEGYVDQHPYRYKVGVFICLETGNDAEPKCKYKFYHEGKWSEFIMYSLGDTPVNTKQLD